MALLGEMYYKPDGVGSWYNLPRESGIAYAAQESWVLNETIKVQIFRSLRTIGTDTFLGQHSLRAAL